MAAYYNEIDPFAAAWLRELIKAGQIAPGDVDERSIADVRPDDLRGYRQCHFFAGIGGWSYALRLAGWPDDREVWTGSCPCQPFSAAGTGGGFADERHLWPAFHWLIEQCRPAVVFGEQVASPAGRRWLDLVATDLEATGYALGSADCPAAGVKAPHLRSRLWWGAVADPSNAGQQRRRAGEARDGGDAPRQQPERLRDARVALGDSRGERLPQLVRRRDQSEGFAEAGRLDELGDSRSARLQERVGDGGVQREAVGALAWEAVVGGSDVGFWNTCDWLPCRDGKWRPVEPGTFPLAHGLPARVGRLRGYGNAIVPQVAATFIAAYLDVVEGRAA